MKLVLDTCVLYPSIMREALLIGAEETGVTPIWSSRILEEWRRAAARRGAEHAAAAEAEITLLKLRHPTSSQDVPKEKLRAFWLPDPADIHVLALAVQSGADGIVTNNAKDFPKHILSEYGLRRLDPDVFLMGQLALNSDPINNRMQDLLAEANSRNTDPFTLRSLCKKARLPRFGKALEAL